MKRILAAILTVGIGLSSASGDEEAYLEARRLVLEGKILPLETIIAGMDRFRSGQVLEVEFEQEGHHMIYEIEILDARGTVWEVKVDAVTGELLEQELED